MRVFKTQSNFVIFFLVACYPLKTLSISGFCCRYFMNFYLPITISNTHTHLIYRRVSNLYGNVPFQWYPWRCQPASLHYFASHHFTLKLMFGILWKLVFLPAKISLNCVFFLVDVYSPLSSNGDYNDVKPCVILVVAAIWTEETFSFTLFAFRFGFFCQINDEEPKGYITRTTTTSLCLAACVVRCSPWVSQPSSSLCIPGDKWYITAWRQLNGMPVSQGV